MFDFDTIYNRRNTNCCKWDSIDKKYNNNDIIHLGVADMDFKVPKAITDTLQKCVNHGIFGYTDLNDNFYNNFICWLDRIHNIKVKEEEIVFCPRIVISTRICVNIFTKQNDEIIINTPAYSPLYNSIIENNRNVIESPLKVENDKFIIDFEQLEQSITKNTKMFIFCNPHNPTGRVWNKDEIEKIGNFCLKHNLILLSDEIHQDIIAEGVKFNSTLSLKKDVRKNLIVLTSPTKTFNICGLIISYIIVPNILLRDKIKKEINRIGMHNPNIFSVSAVETAYKDCDDWYKSLIKYIDENDKFTREYFERYMPKFKISKREGTFLLWINYEALKCSEAMLEKWFIEKAKVSVYMGSSFLKNYENYIRLNIAVPRKLLEEAYNRMLKVYNQI